MTLPVRSRFVAAVATLVVAAAIAAGCTQPVGSIAQGAVTGLGSLKASPARKADVAIIPRTTVATPAPKGATAVNPENVAPKPVIVNVPAVKGAAAGGEIALELKLPETGFGLLATVDDIQVIRAALSRLAPLPAASVGVAEVTRAQFGGGKAALGFKGLTAGTYELRIAAFTGEDESIGEATARTAVGAGEVARLALRLQLTSRPIVRPSAPGIAAVGQPSVAPLPATPTPTVAPKATPTPTPAPTATPTPKPAATATPTPKPTATAAVLDHAAIMREGVARDLVGPYHTGILARRDSAATVSDRTTLDGLLGQAKSMTEKVFILKAFAAGETLVAVQGYAGEIRGAADGDLVSRSTMRDAKDLVQQWEDACGPALLMTAVGEHDPRYAWELNKRYNLAGIDPYGVNKDIANEQKSWLEAYGGKAVPRGQSGGAGIGILNLLNDKLGPVVGGEYRVWDASNLSTALDQMATSLREGYDVPLRITWTRPGAGAEAAHFVLAIATDGAGSSRRFQIHDTFTGQTAWVTETSIKADSFAPIFNVYGRLTHHYAPVPR